MKKIALLTLIASAIIPGFLSATRSVDYANHTNEQIYLWVKAYNTSGNGVTKIVKLRPKQSLDISNIQNQNANIAIYNISEDEANIYLQKNDLLSSNENGAIIEFSA